MNSREKGKRGERQWRDELRAQGFQARRGQQFSGSPDSPDVVCEQLRWIHFEVKAVEKLNVQDAIDQAGRDCGGKVPIVAHRRSFRPWLVTMEAETFFRMLRKDFTEAREGSGEGAGDFTAEARRTQRKDGTLNREKDFTGVNGGNREQEPDVPPPVETRILECSACPTGPASVPSNRKQNEKQTKKETE